MIMQHAVRPAVLRVTERVPQRVRGRDAQLLSPFALSLSPLAFRISTFNFRALTSGQVIVISLRSVRASAGATS